MSWGVLLWVYPVWDSLGFVDLGDYFLPHFREVFNYYLVKYFFMAFLFIFFFWDSYDSNVGAFGIVPEVSEVVLISLNCFFFSVSFISTILSSTSLILSSASVILLLVPSRVFLISVIALFGRRQWHPTPVHLPGKSHGQRSLVGCSPRGLSEGQTRLSDFTFTLHLHALEKEMATHSSILAWRIPWTEEPGRLQSTGS